MIWNRIEQLLGTGRWLPYQLGALASLPFAAAFMAIWAWSQGLYVLWCVFCPFWAGLDVFRRTPVRKMISTAMVLGTVISMVILVLGHRR